MYISLNWLNDYVDLQGFTPQQVGDTLTQLGFEVENSKTLTPYHQDIVVGFVVEARKHPNADTLSLCRVDVGQSELLSIVCGAHNARAGIKVALAQVGSSLPDGMLLKAAKLRGELSQGMMCSERELELSQDHDGIIELSEDCKVGTSINSLIKRDDTIFELKLTAQRGDALSYLGIARELAAKWQRPLRIPPSNLPTGPSFKTALRVEIAHKDICSRFVAIAVHDLKPLKSPLWLRQRLLSSGTRPINLIVDVTNYVMLEQGSPIHAYDERDIKGNVLKVCQALQQHKSMTTLDEKELSLQAEDILICDQNGPVGLAGIMGGKNSEVKADSSHIMIEVASFHPTAIRKTAKRLNLHTEASHRFERGVDVLNIPQVAKRCAYLLLTLSKELGVNVQVAEDMVDIYPQEFVPKKVLLRLERVQSLLARPELDMQTCIRHLKSLGFEPSEQNSKSTCFSVPSRRHDCDCEADLIEEIARLEGYHTIPYQLPKMNIQPAYEDPYIAFREQLRENIAVLGLTEVITYPFCSPLEYSKLELNENHPLWPSMALMNPMNSEQAYLRSTLVPSLLKALSRGRFRGQKGSRLFELGRGFFKADKVAMNSETSSSQKYLDDLQRVSRLWTQKARQEQRPFERELLCGVLDQPWQKKAWNQDEKPTEFHHAKEIITSLLAGFSNQTLHCELIDALSFPFLHPHRSATLNLAGQVLGWVGELHPGVSDAFELLSESPILFEIDIEKLFQILRNHELKTTYKPQRFPAVTRDLALLLPSQLRFEQLSQAVEGFPKKKHLSHFELFDLYEGKELEEGKVSFASTFVFQSLEKTLTDDDVNQEFSQLLSHLESSLGAKQR